MRENWKKLILILLFALAPVFLVWLPFFLRLKSFWTIPLPQDGMATIIANYDGPLYLVVAKTFYNPETIKSNFQFPLPTEYYAAHFPLFPLLIKAFSFLAGYPYSMLLVTLVSGFLALFFFYKFISQYLGQSEALFLTFVFSIFPARWLIVRSVGSAEPLFIATTLASVYFFQNKKYLAAGIFGALAQMVKSPGILLFFAYLISLLLPNLKKFKPEPKKVLPIFLIPLALIAVFTIYALRMHNFWAYFTSGDNIHLFFPPFSIFNYSAPWVGTFWLEEIILVYLLELFGLLRLIQKKAGILSWYVGIFFTSTLFIAHRDLIRYSLPLVPFLLAAYAEVLVKKEFKIIVAVLAIPIYLFSLTYISQNVMPISNWTPFL